MTDQVVASFARYALADLDAPSAQTDADARMIVLDALGVALGAVGYPGAEAVRRYVHKFGATGGCTVWGTSLRTRPELAALANGVPLRAYDYNDLHRGKRTGGHPSDTLAALLPVAEHVAASGRELLTAFEVCYEISFAIMDSLPFGRLGWDYTNVVAVGATCAIGRLMELSTEQLEQAISITVVPHVAMNTIENNLLDAEGELTMWKRFNGADAMRHSIYACELAAEGVRGPVAPYLGRLGLLQAVFADADVDLSPIEAVDQLATPSRMHEVTLKKWPVGSRAQSAVAAALEVHGQIPAGGTIARVRAHVDRAAYDHLVRDEAWSPSTRTQADHSLPYVVAVALATGQVTPDSFSDETIRSPHVVDLVKRTEVEPDESLTRGGVHGFPARVTVDLEDGESLSATARDIPGSEANPMRIEDVREKFMPQATPVIGRDRAAEAVSAVVGLDALPVVTTLTELLRT